ncbi:ComEC/Rec2 family competence protein [Rathayibacter sp. KR2-224]|uniref:ComEC/Rec2 family competence protein n=1 Tax=Rathayibacter sp. KR2-224 TaxID=3400913 RepID=UPI003BFBF82B
MIDLRLAVPAIAAWVGAAAAISLPNGWWFAIALWTVAIAAAGTAVALRVAARHAAGRSGHPTLPVVVAALCVATAAAALVATAAASAMPARHPDVVAALAHHSVVLRAQVTSQGQASSATGSGAAGVRFSATVETVTAGAERHRVRMPVLVFSPQGTSVRIGQVVEVNGTVTMLPSSSETAALVYASARPRAVAAPPALLETADSVRAAFTARASQLPGDGGALLPGLAIGDVHGLPESLSDDMKQASLTHLTAVSGANCAVVVSLVGAAAGALGLGRGIRVLASLAALTGFVVLVTPQPSVLRASVMAAVIVFAGWTGRRGRAVPALSLAVVALLAIDPWLSLSYGFVLSVLATGALLLLAPPLSQRLAAWMPHRVAMLLAVPISAQVACQPVLLLLNPTVPLYGIIANLVAEPAAPIATVLGLLSCLVIPLWPAAGGLLAQLAWVPSAWIAAVARVSSALPGSGLGWIDGALGFVLMLVLTVAIVFAVARPRHRMARAARLIALCAAVTVSVCSLAGVAGAKVAEALDRPQSWSIAACDIGQGDAVLLRSGDAHALVDTGPDPDRLTSCLSELGIGRIDLLVLTHYDMDHVGGTQSVIGKVGVAMVGPPSDERGRRINEQLERGGAQVQVAQTGDAGRLGDLAWRVLWPDRESHGMEPGNERSVTVLFTGDGIRSLFLGDLDERAQDALLETGRVPRVDVVKVAHHGSGDQAEPLYAHMGAAIGLISVGADNDYGHPTATALGILKSTGTVVMRTDVEGMLMVASDGHGRLTTWTQRAATAPQLARPG